ncbi:MAG: SRPBCC domain-containing protein [Candidatus Bathyarchaeota archaeon]|nr:SRPBCC domain-containing protein [Candidatus Bathyarchaeota archaeon]
MKSLVLDISLKASIDKVWSYWTEVDKITEWFSPEANIEARVGGPYELFFDPENHEHMSTIGCVVTHLTPMSLLGFTWKDPDEFACLMNKPDKLTQVKVEFTKEGETTQIKVTHSGWRDDDEWKKAHDWHKRAWEGVLASLTETLEP